MIALIALALLTVAIAAFVIRNSEMFKPVEGYEDEEGFHFGRDPKLGGSETLAEREVHAPGAVAFEHHGEHSYPY